MNDRPWMAALQTQLAARRELISICAISPHTLEQAARYRQQGFRSDVSWIGGADTYSWSDETISAALLASRSMPLDSSLTREMLPSTSGWWHFESPISLDSLDKKSAPRLNAVSPRGVVPFVALLFHPDTAHPESDLLAFRMFVAADSIPNYKGEIGAWVSWNMRFGTDLSHYVSMTARNPELSGLIVAVTKLFFAGCVWLKQRIIDFSLGHVERHERKRLEREHNQQIPSDVKVVQLRRRESAQRADGIDGVPVDWSCRWIVNGHWRNQPYKDQKKLIYILPYVKGPDDKPLKVPTQTVYQVSR